VDGNGNHTAFSSLAGLGDELKIAVARDNGYGSSLGGGGFQSGDVFLGNGNQGQIVRIRRDPSAPGGLNIIPWVSLGTDVGLFRGSLFVDRYGDTFHGDLIAVTTTGYVWQIRSNGESRQGRNPDDSPKPLAVITYESHAVHLEGLTTVPNDPARYGPWAGKILAGAEQLGRVYAIDTNGY